MRSTVDTIQWGTTPDLDSLLRGLCPATVLKPVRGHMYRIWYWAMIDRENDGRFIASIPDLGDLAAYGDNEKDAVAHVAVLAADHVRAVVESGHGRKGIDTLTPSGRNLYDIW
jgi:predicted RNase H-like HicB family nuclease